MFRKKGGEETHRSHRVLRAVLLACLVLGALGLWGPTVYVNLATRHDRYELSRFDITALPKHDVGIVFGAALQDQGKNPSPYLEWRIETAVRLYKAGKVSKLLMTGDGSYPSHDEPAVMRRVAIDLGVPADKIEMDKFGFDTYDSCSRARVWRNITSAIVVTQGYHVPRAVFSCQKVGINTIGVNAQARYGRSVTGFDIVREWLSTDKLFVQLIAHKYHIATPAVPKNL